MTQGKAPSQGEGERHDNKSADASCPRLSAHLAGGSVFAVIMYDPSARETGKSFNDGKDIEPQRGRQRDREI